MLLYLVELDLNSACFFFSGHDLLKLTGIISELFSTFHTILTCIQTCNIVMENLLQLCGRVPQLKGARHFSFVEITKSTDNFSKANHIGSGGYGMVYRGMLPTGQLIAIKRCRQGSVQGGLEFNAKMEVLSRVHHKNIVI